MQKITQKLVDQMNEEVSSDTFWEIVEKYQLETPEKYTHLALYEQDGIEVWGESEDGEVLVYDNTNGFYLLSKTRWIQEIRNIYEEEAEVILSELGVIEPLYHEFTINGFEAVEKTVASGNKSSARINVPPAWQGKRVIVVRLE